MTSPDETDMRERWLPSPASVRHARAVLEAEPRADVAAIPMVLPGKRHGFWKAGQEVLTVPGVVLIGNSRDSGGDGDVPGWSWTRNVACSLARAYLAGLPGTVAYAAVYREGGEAVFEDPAAD
jgi:hypothetical protein